MNTIEVHSKENLPVLR